MLVRAFSCNLDEDATQISYDDINDTIHYYHNHHQGILLQSAIITRDQMGRVYRTRRKETLEFELD